MKQIITAAAAAVTAISVSYAAPVTLHLDNFM